MLGYLRALVILWGTGLLSSPVDAEQLIIAADPWCPLNCAPDSDKPGYLIEIAQQVLSAAGHTVEYKTMPWARAIQEARRGKIAAIAGAYREDAPDFVFPALEQAVVYEAIFVRNDKDWRYQGVDSLAQVSLGVVKDYAYFGEINEYLEKNQGKSKNIQVADGENALEINIRKVLRGRLDALLESEAVFWYNAGELGVAEQFKSAGRLYNEAQQAYIAFSPVLSQAQHYAGLISEGMVKLRQSGELAKILAKYNLKDWK